MTLEILLRCLIDHYMWNEEATALRTPAALLRAMAEVADGEANEIEEEQK